MFTRDRQSEGMNPIMKIKEGTREIKLPGLIGVGAIGVAEAGTVGNVMSVVVLGSSRMFLAKRNDVQNS